MARDWLITPEGNVAGCSMSTGGLNIVIIAL